MSKINKTKQSEFLNEFFTELYESKATDTKFITRWNPANDSIEFSTIDINRVVAPYWYNTLMLCSYHTRVDNRKLDPTTRYYCDYIKALYANFWFQYMERIIITEHANVVLDVWPEIEIIKNDNGSFSVYNSLFDESYGETRVDHNTEDLISMLEVQLTDVIEDLATGDIENEGLTDYVTLKDLLND